MNAVNTTSIDGHEIIISITPGADYIDPVNTEKRITPMIAETDVFKQIQAKKQQMSVYAQQRHQAAVAGKKAATNEQSRKLADEFRLRNAQIAELEAELTPLNSELLEVRRELVKSHAVYTNPPVGTVLVKDAAALTEKMIAAVQKGVKLKLDGSEIVDNRGKTFHKKTSGEWFKFTPSRLGDAPPDGAILDADLTDAQRQEIATQTETNRIKALSSADKSAELASRLDGLMSQAVNKRMGLEIQGDKDALKKSQDWYNAEKTALEAVYK